MTWVGSSLYPQALCSGWHCLCAWRRALLCLLCARVSVHFTGTCRLLSLGDRY